MQTRRKGACRVAEWVVGPQPG